MTRKTLFLIDEIVLLKGYVPECQSMLFKIPYILVRDPPEGQSEV